jgi:hypothetical protein
LQRQGDDNSTRRNLPESTRDLKIQRQDNTIKNQALKEDIQNYGIIIYQKSQERKGKETKLIDVPIKNKYSQIITSTFSDKSAL